MEYLEDPRLSTNVSGSLKLQFGGDAKEGCEKSYWRSWLHWLARRPRFARVGLPGRSPR